MIDNVNNMVCVTPTSSFFAANGLFGSWPSQDDITALIAWGVDVIVNLASASERKVTPYTVPPDTNITVINFPIRDTSIPDDKIAFCSLVVKICDFLSKDMKVYIHCKGGHGRSGLLVAAVIAYTRRISPFDAIALTNEYHSKRQVMKEIWRSIGSPQTGNQKKFVIDMFPVHDTAITGVENYMKMFLIQTNLGRIVGPRGEKLMRLREKLMKSCNKVEC